MTEAGKRATPHRLILMILISMLYFVLTAANVFCVYEVHKVCIEHLLL